MGSCDGYRHQAWRRCTGAAADSAVTVGRHRRPPAAASTSRNVPKTSGEEAAPFIRKVVEVPTPPRLNTQQGPRPDRLRLRSETTPPPASTLSAARSGLRASPRASWSRAPNSLTAPRRGRTDHRTLGRPSRRMGHRSKANASERRVFREGQFRQKACA